MRQALTKCECPPATGLSSHTRQRTHTTASDRSTPTTTPSTTHASVHHAHVENTAHVFCQRSHGSRHTKLWSHSYIACKLPYFHISELYTVHTTKMKIYMHYTPVGKTPDPAYFQKLTALLMRTHTQPSICISQTHLVFPHRATEIQQTPANPLCTDTSNHTQTAPQHTQHIYTIPSDTTPMPDLPLGPPLARTAMSVCLGLEHSSAGTQLLNARKSFNPR